MIQNQADRLKKVMVALTHREEADLSIRQLAILLHIYTVKESHTVRALAEYLQIGKPAVTRAIDRLELLGYLRRKPDTRDKRNVLLERTVKGAVFISEISSEL